MLVVVLEWRLWALVSRFEDSALFCGVAAIRMDWALPWLFFYRSDGLLWGWRRSLLSKEVLDGGGIADVLILGEELVVDGVGLRNIS